MARIVKKFADRKADIVKAAGHLFQSKEYDKTTMQDVMEALGVAKGTIYHYFKSKEALLEAVIEDVVDRNMSKMQAIVKEARGNALQKMKLLVATGRVSERNENILEQLHKPGNSGMHCRLLAEILTRQAPLYAEVIQQGCEEGIFKTEAPLECAEFILSGIQFLTDIGIYPWTPEALSRRMLAFPKLIEQQLRAPKGSFDFINEQK